MILTCMSWKNKTIKNIIFHYTRGVARVCGARGNFSVYIFLPKGWPLEKLRGEKWQAKKQKNKTQKLKKKRNLTFYTHTVCLHVLTLANWQIGGTMSYTVYVFIRPMKNVFVLGMPNGWSYIFLTLGKILRTQGTGSRGKCPPLPPTPPPLVTRLFCTCMSTTTTYAQVPGLKVWMDVLWTLINKLWHSVRIITNEDREHATYFKNT